MPPAAILDIDGTLVDTTYMALIEEVEPFRGARELIVDLKERGNAVVLASSAKPDEVDHYLDLLDARELVGDSTWDCIAAGRAGIATVAVLTGGFSEAELREAGAAVVFESIEVLRTRLGETSLGDGEEARDLPHQA